ncbi:EndoU domain-containing protein [Olleya sp. ITB9]|uniref:EndoU domain-containing protein n=1 Tax=Olleya sp. ITB9 TaxID=1715648 RepID=UPI000B288112|nr:EndoU domain-containing protein [Olleya sp. ITB9]
MTLEKYLQEIAEKIKLRGAALAKYLSKFEKKFHKHFDGELVAVKFNDGSIAYYKMAGAHNHEKIGEVFEIIAIRKPPGVKFKNLPDDIPFKANVEMIVDGVKYTKKATSTLFPKNWDINRVKEEIALVYDDLVKSGKDFSKFPYKHKIMNSEETFEILIEFDEFGNLTNAYPWIKN